ncbi:biopolymer transport protein TolR [Glaciecola punicea ACAM 611]|jgi:biopolymer transport protein TolR|uniref:Tol-Pal system protein TolR n=1 Tax=Glaciecola punicea ACAM 611 TaxID=1121923 RepID=H5TBL2_9ALTE|nr:protein TolR [Glaciecola punicea]OFA30944.1 protein TolR [Glaciecola punicea]GAB55689.1 biopolymer transport protein TolR [Glaciecola punicea ACAM 611]
MYVRKRRKPVSEINVVPYIDVMLVLLVIFMATATAVTQGVQVDLPKAEAQTIQTEDEPMMIVSVDADGLYYLNVGDEPANAMSGAAVAELVRTRLLVAPTTPVVVNGDGNVRYEKVIDLMVMLQRAGVPSVGLMTDPDES